MPIFAATAATWRVWFDCTPPIVTSVSAFEAKRIGNDIFELAQLVAAEREAGIAVLALGVDLDLVAKMRAQAPEPLDRRRPEGERIAFEFLQHGRSCAADEAGDVRARRVRPESILRALPSDEGSPFRSSLRRAGGVERRPSADRLRRRSHPGASLNRFACARDDGRGSTAGSEGRRSAFAGS